jgi:pyruvate dehydrogenase E2 component (dihydrolipoamide acetyltransferase)
VIDVVMPKFGWTMTEGTITEWYRAENERVSEGDPLFCVETEKVNTDVDAPASGVLTEVRATAGTTVRVGEVVARIAAAS